VEPEELDAQQQRVRKAAAAGAETVKRAAPAPMPDHYPPPAKVPPAPLAPLASLWPASTPAPARSQSSPAPAQQTPKSPAGIPAAHASAAPPSPPVKLPVQWQPKALPGEQAVTDVPLPPAPPKVRVTFAVVDPGARQVSLSGDFNDWSPDATPMKLRQEGRWEATVQLAPGRYQYKFVVNGHWIPDPQARETVWNQHGTLNSVIEVRA